MEYVYSLLVLVGIYVVLSASFNLIIGYGGLISIAHPVFFAIGAYTAALCGIHLGTPFAVSVVIGALVALAASFAVSLPALRVSGDFLLIASLGFQLGVVQFIRNINFTGGPGGLSNVPETIAGAQRGPLFAALSLVFALLVVLLIRWITTGPYGRAITAMRDDEIAFSTLGRHAMRIKIVIFALGSCLAGLAGGFYAYYYQFLAPDQFDILQSAMLLTMVVVGGMGTTLGPVVGAVLLLALPQAITFIDLPTYLMGPLQGLLFTSLVLIFIFTNPEGLVAAGKERR